MQVTRVLSALLKINIQQELAYRVDTLVNILTSIMGYVTLATERPVPIEVWRMGRTAELFRL